MFSFIFVGFIVLLAPLIGAPGLTQAYCGPGSCFQNIGNQPGIQPQGTLRGDVAYSYVPHFGPRRRVASVNVENNEQILGDHKEIETFNQQVQFTLNYGVTDAFTFQLTIPIIFRDHDHRIGVGIEPEDGPNEGKGEFENFDAAGIGDIRLMGKFGFSPTLQSQIVMGAGLEVPTGDSEAKNSEGRIQEPNLQVGRGDYGLVGQVYQTYELIPQTLKQFLSYTYRHTFKNKFDYQFGDTHVVSGGLMYHVVPSVALSGQLDWIYSLHDRFRSRVTQAGGVGPGMAGEQDVNTEVRTRKVRNTGSTNLLFTPGITVHFPKNASWYFYSQIPLVQDFNGALEQGVSFMTGIVKFLDFDP